MAKVARKKGNKPQISVKASAKGAVAREANANQPDTTKNKAAEKADKRRHKEQTKRAEKARMEELKRIEKTRKTGEKQRKAETKKFAKTKPSNGDARIKYEHILPREEAVSYFEAVVSGLREGNIQFKQGEESLKLSPPDYLEVEVKAARKGAKEKVAFEISWRKDSADGFEVSLKPKKPDQPALPLK